MTELLLFWEVALEFELRALHSARQALYHLSQTPSNSY
jgi:hypothetical protein